MPKRQQQVAHGASSQKGQGPARNVSKRDSRMLQLESLPDAARRQGHNRQKNARRSRPEMRAHKLGGRKLKSHQLRHDVIHGPEHHHHEEPVGIQQAPRNREPGEAGEVADLGQRARRVHQAPHDKGDQAKTDKPQGGMRHQPRALSA